jgi:hypothetical protein
MTQWLGELGKAGEYGLFWSYGGHEAPIAEAFSIMIER